MTKRESKKNRRKTEEMPVGTGTNKSSSQPTQNGALKAAPITAAPSLSRRVTLKWTPISTGCPIRTPQWEIEIKGTSIEFFDSLLGKLGALPIGAGGGFAGTILQNLISGTVPGSVMMKTNRCDFSSFIPG